jgi:hypothetical protein
MVMGVLEDEHKLNELIKRIDGLIIVIEERVKQEGKSGNQAQYVVHEYKGMGTWGAAAVVGCFATWIALIVLALWESNLWAWKDIHDHRISVLEAKTK